MRPMSRMPTRNGIYAPRDKSRWEKELLRIQGCTGASKSGCTSHVAQSVGSRWEETGHLRSPGCESRLLRNKTDLVMESCRTCSSTGLWLVDAVRHERQHASSGRWSNFLHQCVTCWLRLYMAILLLLILYQSCAGIALNQTVVHTVATAPWISLYFRKIWAMTYRRWAFLHGTHADATCPFAFLCDFGEVLKD